MNNSNQNKRDLSVTLTRLFGPGCLAGIKLGDWCQLLTENSLQIDPRYWGRAVHLSLASMITSPVSWLEALFNEPSYEASQIEPPLFVLGSWRSGTTHLHNVLCQDVRFSAPDLFQTMYPHTFRSSRWWLEPALRVLTPKKRFMDNVKMSLREPAEDEMALGILCRKSNSFSWVFPKNASKYDRYLSFKTAPEKDQEAFREALRYFVAKVQQASEGRPLILKSPNHTARIKLILEVFPNAKFLHIHRNPFEVYQSFLHMAQNVIPVWALQKFDFSQVHAMVLASYKELYQAYLDDRDLIPEGQHVEIAYEKLVENPLPELERIYNSLNLPDFNIAKPEFESYLNKTGSYQRNKHLNLSSEVCDQIIEKWGVFFDTFGYSRELNKKSLD